MVDRRRLAILIPEQAIDVIKQRLSTIRHIVTHLGLEEVKASGVNSTEDVADEATPVPPTGPEAMLEVGVSFPVGVVLSKVGGDRADGTSAGDRGVYKIDNTVT